MAKVTTSFVCQECGYDSPAYLGKCPECGSWNSLKEFKIHPPARGSKLKVVDGTLQKDLKPKTLGEIGTSFRQRLATGFSEMDVVLGSGIVKGSVVLLAGDPGVGKSTLLLQTALNISRGPVGSPSTATTPSTVLYVSGEESVEQIKLRADRLLGEKKDGEKLPKFFLLSVTNVNTIIETVEQTKPSLLIIDSIQTMESEEAGGLAGSVAQIRYATAVFIRLAKALNIPIIMVGHVTKQGDVAGPMVLSHMVDVVLFFEGDKENNTRILRSFKNRFGPVDEVGIFIMEEHGVQEIKNPEQLFLSEKSKGIPGSVLTCTLEGTRTFLVEIQALAVFSKLPMPRRVASGIDARRLELLLAVLQKHANLRLETMDVFVNVAGGLKITDRAIDLAVCLAIYSSLKDLHLSDLVAISEVGLLGELRMVPFLDKRIREATKLGFKNIASVKKNRSLNDVIKSLDK